MSRRLSVVLAALHEPVVLLLDEPFDGVDPLGVEATLEVVADARARGACVLLSTHLRDLALEACGEAVVLRGGNRVAAMQAGDLTGEAYRALLD
jgi:ABC-2 type transport system ATP-binding protein